ncbi:putative dioxygenase [Marinobacterium lacunae]|uniref:Putative dioxygenase n=1 Tax=Marinobacterium lacunae TaxID=1232683 RepID=A0A081FWL1_9GAMM|nr:VOC family protein [Marinobacterium lacunae]KEA62916.1 putative dioxygenase [Marinobacterium lacunae]
MSGSNQSIHPFHLAFPVRELEEARHFYGHVLGCSEGRCSPGKWCDFNFYGHQIVAHVAPEECGCSATSDVDNHKVPARHFGIVLPMDEWQALADRLKGLGIDFVIEPYIRFAGEVGEQATMFFLDPSDNAIEIKAFKNIDTLFAK